MNKFKTPSILMLILIFLFIITEFVYIFSSQFDMFHVVRFSIFILSSVFILIHIILKIKYHQKEKDLLVWKMDLLDAGLDSLVDNFTVLDQDLKIVYTNYKIIDELISKDRLKIIKNHKITDVFDSIDKVYIIEKKLNDIMENKIESRFIVKINEKKYLAFVCPLYNQNKEVTGLVCLVAKYIEQDSIITI